MFLSYFSEYKTISRSFLNGSNEEELIKFGLHSPEGIAIDQMSQNIYWTDSGLNRIEVARSNGMYRKVLIWEDLHHPKSIVSYDFKLNICRIFNSCLMCIFESKYIFKSLGLGS